MAHLVREGVGLAYEEAGRGEPVLVLVHGMACHRGFWRAQLEHFAPRHRVVAVDLRGHGESDAPEQRYTMQGFADDVAWACGQLDVEQCVVLGHSLGGLVALELAAAHAELVAGVVLVDSILLPDEDRFALVRRLVSGLRGPDGARILRNYYGTFFAAGDDAARRTWILDECAHVPAYVTSSAWEESMENWDDAVALRACPAPLLYLDAGTPNADLGRVAELCPQMVVGRTVASGHFSPLEVPEQVDAMIDRFLAVGLGEGGDDESAPGAHLISPWPT